MAFILRRLVPLLLLGLLWVPAASAWSWPVDGPVLQQFSFDPAHPYAAGQHRGVDLGAPTGSTVLAPAAGVVTFAGSVPTSGLCLTIETADGYSVTLTHLGTVAVARGASVAEGDAVGTVGPSGTPDFDVPYVHLGVRLAGDPNGYLDPLTLLPPVAPPATPDASPAPAVSAAPPTVTSSAGSAATPESPQGALPSDVTAAAAAVSAPSAGPAVQAAPSPAAAPAAVETPTPAAEARPSVAPAHRPTSEPAATPVRVHVRAQAPVAIAAAGGRAHEGWRPQPALGEPVPLQRRPAPVQSSPREAPAAGGRQLPLVPIALGVCVALLAGALWIGILRPRRRPAGAPEGGAIVIPLPRRSDRLEERHAA